MVIEIDRKKIATARRSVWIVSVAYIVMLLSYGLLIMDAFSGGTTSALIGLFISQLLFSLVILITSWHTFRRALRHRRTEHHLYMDGTGITMVNGHARIDIPWGDIEKISIDGRNKSIRPRRIKMWLRKDTPYNKRTYRLYDDYEQPLDELYTQINEMWSAGQAKPKLLTI